MYPGWEDAPFDRVTLVLRLWNALLTAAIPLLLWATARRLALPHPVPIVAALFPLAVPEFVHTAASVNNDNLLVLLAAALTLLVARVLTGDTRRRTALGIGLLATLALLTKGFALMIPVWVVLAYVVAAVRFRRWTALISLGVAGLTLLPGLAWWIRNQLVYGTPQPNGYLTDPPDLTARYGWSDGGPAWLFRSGERLITLFFVHDQTGGRQHTAPWWMAMLAMAFIVAGILVVLLLPVLPRWNAMVLLTPLLGLLAIVAMGSWELFAATQKFGGIQGRYLYAALPAIGVLAVAAVARLPGRFRRFGPLAVLGFATAIQAVYIVYTLDLFWVPTGRTLAEAPGRVVGAIFDWYALPSGVLGAIMVATAVALGWLTSALVQEVRQAPAAAGNDDREGLVSAVGSAPDGRPG